jgi:hypothetical protein
MKKKWKLWREMIDFKRFSNNVGSLLMGLNLKKPISFCITHHKIISSKLIPNFVSHMENIPMLISSKITALF